MLFIFYIFFGLATCSTSASDHAGPSLHQDKESDTDDDHDGDEDDEVENEVDDVTDTYNISYSDRMKWAYHDCYKPKKRIFQRKHILAICVCVGEYLLTQKECQFETVESELKGFAGITVVDEALDILNNDETKLAAKEAIKNLRTQIKAKEPAYRRMVYEGGQMLKGIPASRLKQHIRQKWGH